MNQRLIIWSDNMSQRDRNILWRRAAREAMDAGRKWSLLPEKAVA